MRRFYFIFLLFIPFTLFSSTIDSLKNILQSNKLQSDTSKVNVLLKLSYIYLERDLDSSLYYIQKSFDIVSRNRGPAILYKLHKRRGVVYYYRGEYPKANHDFHKALEYASMLKDSLFIASMEYLIGATYDSQNQYDIAERWFKKALSLAKHNNYEKIIGNCYNGLGIIYKKKGEFEKAIENYLNALKIAEKDNNKEEILNLYNNLGVLYKQQKLYNNALPYYKKALSIAQKNNIVKYKINIYNNLGVIFEEIGEPDTALFYYHKAIQIAVKLKDREGLYITYINIGNLYNKIKQLDKAEKYYNKAISLYDKEEKKEGLGVAYNSLANLYLNYAMQNNLPPKLRNKYFEKAIHFAKIIYELADNNGNVAYKASAAKILSDAFGHLKKYKKAWRYATEYISIQDKLYDSKKLAIIRNIEGKYKEERSKLIIEKLRKEKELYEVKAKKQELKAKLDNRQKLFALIIITLLIIIITYMLINIRRTRRLNKNLKEKTQKLKQAYMHNIKQNIEIRTQATQIEKQQKELKKTLLKLKESEEELQQQNDLLMSINIKVSEQKIKIESLLKKYQDTIKHMNDVYIRTDSYFRCIETSPSIKKYLELDSENEIIGKHIAYYWVIPKEVLIELTQTIKAEGSILNYMIVYKTKKNKLRYARFNARAIFDKYNNFKGVEALVYDITSDIEYQNKIQELNHQKELLINNLPQAIYYKDINLRYIEVNKKYAKLLGKRFKEIIGKTDAEVQSDIIKTECEDLDKEALKTGKPILNKVKKYENEGEEYWMSISKLPFFDNNGNIAGIIGVFEDITERVKQEKILKINREKIERAYKEITENIRYAKTIQEALLPSASLISKYWEKSFVIFKPRNEVSGDFYYFKKTEEYLIFAAGDCTGHGVSGAFISMIAITSLNDIISTKTVTKASQALEMLRYRVKSIFYDFGTENKNGLDIALCTLNIKNKELDYSGAFNPLFIVRKDEIIEYKATRNPIGFYVNEEPFVSHIIKLEEGDNIYIFSDGFIDQFGGPKGKKYSKKRLKAFLISISKYPMDFQKELLEKEFENWKGENEQTDDVVMIGIKI